MPLRRNSISPPACSSSSPSPRRLSSSTVTSAARRKRAFAAGRGRDDGTRFSRRSGVTPSIASRNVARSSLPPSIIRRSLYLALLRHPVAVPATGSFKYSCSVLRSSRERGVRILLSNDDGYRAQGLKTLAERLADFAEITIVAPERNQSGVSNSLTLETPLRV